MRKDGVPRSVALYARISQDRSGEALGVKRQVADCEREADRRGWGIGELYVDDDVSAYSGRMRPEYQRMLDDIRAGLRDGVIVYHLDRLTRRTVELEEFVSVCDSAGVRHVATVHGDVNLGNADGLLVARIQAAVAANESDAKSRRQKRKILEQAEAGAPHMGGVRPFGFGPDKVTVIPEEAAAIRDICARFLAGDAIRSLAVSLNDQGITTVTGRPWRSETIRNLIGSARISGRRELHGQIIGKAQWPAIISAADSDRIRTILADPSRVTNRSARRYLLSGLLRCGKCGKTLVSSPRDGVRRYGCKGSRVDFDGCNGIFVKAQWIEDLISRAVVQRFDNPNMQAALDGTDTTDGAAQQLRDEITADEGQLLELAEMYANRQINASEWATARKTVERRAEANRRKLARSGHAPALAGYLAKPGRLQAEWDTLTLNRQRAIVAAVLDYATVMPAHKKGEHGFDASRVKPRWKL